MNDIMVKFAGGQCDATSCGSKNPAVAMIAQMILGGNQYGVAQTQDIQAQSVGNAAAIAAGGIGF